MNCLRALLHLLARFFNSIFGSERLIPASVAEGLEPVVHTSLGMCFAAEKKARYLLFLTLLLSTLLLGILSFWSPRSPASSSWSCRRSLGGRRFGSCCSAASFSSGIIAATIPGFSICALAIALAIFTTTAAITPNIALTTMPNTITAITQVLAIFLIVVSPRPSFCVREVGLLYCSSDMLPKFSFCLPRSSASSSFSCRRGLGVRQVGSYYSTACVLLIFLLILRQILVWIFWLLLLLS